jgi:precorrin-4 methylase
VGRRPLAVFRGIRPVLIKEVGSGRGFHGLKRFQGVPVVEILKKLGVAPGIDSVALLTSTDGYQSLLSYGEIALSALGEQIVISEVAGNPKKFVLVVPHDTLADRMVKTVNKVEVISLNSKPRLYVIGVGCGDTSLVTLEAISRMGNVDAFISPKDLAERFAKYMGNKPILFDPFSSFEPELKKKNPSLNEGELKRRLEAQRTAEMKSLRDTLSSGKSVAVLDYGDPTMYGGWQRWLEPEFSGKLEVVPGISAFSAANAMMGYNLACNKDSMIITTPKASESNQGMLQSVATKGDPVAIYMGLQEMKTLVPLLKKHYPATTPVTIAYKAGYSRDGRLVKTTLDRVLADTEKEKEQQLGLIYIGRNLR